MHYTVRMSEKPGERDVMGPFGSPQEALAAGYSNWPEDHWWLLYKQKEEDRESLCHQGAQPASNQAD